MTHCNPNSSIYSMTFFLPPARRGLLRDRSWSRTEFPSPVSSPASADSQGHRRLLIPAPTQAQRYVAACIQVFGEAVFVKQGSPVASKIFAGKALWRMYFFAELRTLNHNTYHGQCQHTLPTAWRLCQGEGYAVRVLVYLALNSFCWPPFP